jgi:hypothetical protein
MAKPLTLPFVVLFAFVIVMGSISLISIPLLDPHAPLPSSPHTLPLESLLPPVALGGVDGSSREGEEGSVGGGGGTFRIEVVRAAHPRIEVWHNFLSPEVCQHLIR